MVFKKGGVGNPKGRGSEKEKIQKHIKEMLIHLSPKVARKLELMLEDPDHMQFAVKTILERVYGKPTEDIEISGKDGGPIQAIIEVINARKQDKAS